MRLKIGDTEKDLTLRYEYHNVISHCRYLVRDEHDVREQEKKSEKGLSYKITLNDNAINLLHALRRFQRANRSLRLLDASHRVDNNTHDNNEILSIIEVLCEVLL